MDRARWHTAAIFLGLALSGCASSPWSTSKTAGIKDSPLPPAAPASAAATSDPKSTPTPEASAQAMQAVMAELRDLGTIDPAARDKLMEDLRQTDPGMWPLVMRQFRATAEYRRKALASQPAAYVQPAASTPQDRPLPDMPGQVIQASYTPPPVEALQVPCTPSAPVDGRQCLAGAIEALEKETPANAGTPAEVAQHARLRMFYLLAGRHEDALRPIPGASPAAQEFWSKELAALDTWLDIERTPDDGLRAAETKPLLVEAISKLSEAAPLVIRNLVFCTEVQSFGCVKRFEKYDFRPNQEVLLYAEVENFASERTSQGYHTSLRSSYQIFDGRGQRVAQQSFSPTEENCQNARRDFFIGYHLRMPKRIGPGKYTLQLVIEDLMCRKTGQASIEFSVREKGKDEK
jgi:hypothetical protein